MPVKDGVHYIYVGGWVSMPVKGSLYVLKGTVPMLVKGVRFPDLSKGHGFQIC